MKLVTYARGLSTACGILTEKGIIDININTPQDVNFHSIKEILVGGQAALDSIRPALDICEDFIDLDSVELLSPILHPQKLLALAGNYEKHVREAARPMEMMASPKENTTPRPFLMPPNVITGSDTTIPWPCYSEEIDYEVELAAVIGKSCKNVSPEQALEYVAGYTIANDISARSVTFKDGREERPWDKFYDWLNGKWADSFLAMGPCLVTADEIGDPQNIDLSLSVNGQQKQSSNTKNMIFSVAETVSFISHIMTLEPGDIIATGTPEGVGMGTGVFLNPGDVMTCEIDKIGTLTNTLGAKPEKFYTPLKD